MSDTQAETDLFFVREEMAEALPPPSSAIGPAAWLRKNLASTPGDLAVTVIGSLVALWALWGIVEWALLDATFTGEDRTACLVDTGACWAFVKAKFAQFIYGRYPLDERWRPTLVMALLALSILWLAIPSAPAKKWGAGFALIGLPVLSFVLLTGGVFGLQAVDTSLWGGLLVTLVVSYVGIVASLPLGVLLALGRRSDMPAVRTFCIAFIELWRGVPLITVLFMASVMLPLFLPPGVTFDKLLRALIGVALFASAYMAEVIRGGLQAIPKGQYEAASAMGLGYWQSMRLIILPQALKLVIPGIVNTFIGLFKDTSLVIIIGLFDLLGAVRQNFADPNWATPQTPGTGLVFAAFVFWAFCFAMSRYSQYVERRLHTGHRT